MSGFQLQRLGILMEPEPGNPQEIEGVLNPAATRGPDGMLYLFPRYVAKGNYSRIGIARVKFNEVGDPCGVERLGIALEPSADYERRSDGSGGCEDARVTFVEPLRHYVMTYTALSPGGPRMVDREHESIWISYCPMPPKGLVPHRPGLFNSHHRLATPVSPWEKLKIGGGTPPVLTKYGWLILYHGVSKMAEPGNDGRQLCYSAGVMLLSKAHPHEILYRSAEPVLTPELPQERHGTIANVVFPTGIDRRDDLGSPDRFDVYFGMADNRIGVARLDMPEYLPPGALADKDGAKTGGQE
ncbi:glycosidase [bacterium]|nr:MAG: glycosidase [bacterium]